MYFPNRPSRPKTRSEFWRRPSGPLVTPAMLDRLEAIELHRVRVEIP